jgi:hypothetical protein
MESDPEPPLRARVRWGNVARALALVAVAALVVAWPRLRAPAPEVPRGTAVPVRQAPATVQKSEAPTPPEADDDAPPRARATPKPAARKAKPRRRAHRRPRPARTKPPAPRRRPRTTTAAAPAPPRPAPARPVAPAWHPPGREEFGVE